MYIFDLDGTLIDSSERMHQLFCDLITECKLSKEEYWAYKRNKINHKKLLEMLYPNRDFEDFNTRWMPAIETEYYLKMDKNYPDTIAVLKELRSKGHKICLLTARQAKTRLMEELDRLKILSYFDYVLTTESKYSKEDMIKMHSEIDREILDIKNIFVSDMGKDINIGNKFGYNTVAITHGFMSEEMLQEYCPQKIIHELTELLA